MGQTLGVVVVHVIFSTKNRMPHLQKVPDLHRYLAAAVRDSGCECYRVGGVADHVHLAIRLSRTVTLAALIGDIKATSSKWIKSQGVREFEWQRGYGVFSVGPSSLPDLVKYIDEQVDHHARVDFQSEFRAMLKKYGVEFDERYVWD